MGVLSIEFADTSSSAVSAGHRIRGNLFLGFFGFIISLLFGGVACSIVASLPGALGGGGDEAQKKITQEDSEALISSF